MIRKALLRTCIPILLRVSTSFVFLMLSIFWHTISDFNFEKDIELSIGFIAFEQKVTMVESRFLFGVIAFMIMFSVFIRDYQDLFPAYFNMDVRFDYQGIERLLSEFQKDKRFKFEIHPDWKSKRISFYENIENVVKEKTGKIMNFGSGDQITAQGHTSFAVKKQETLSQSYKITDSEGRILINDVNSNVEIETFFHLKDTAESLIRITFADMIARYTFLINPRFLQKYRTDPTEEVNFGDLIACTPIRFFPVMSIGYSLYLAEEENKWFPIAYCIYDY